MVKNRASIGPTLARGGFVVHCRPANMSEAKSFTWSVYTCTGNGTAPYNANLPLLAVGSMYYLFDNQP